MARRLRGAAGMFKIGSQLFTAEGPRGIARIARCGCPLFLDLKFHDIPNTVAGAVAAAARHRGVALINIHAQGGVKMMRAAAAALPARSRARLIAVTVLTSMDAAELRTVGIAGAPMRRAAHLARLARRAGLHGVVASGEEARGIRQTCGSEFIIVVPGVRPGSAARGDQSRVVTPAEAIRAGADYLVVGRPITQARNPRAAALAIIEEIAGALAQKTS